MTLINASFNGGTTRKVLWWDRDGGPYDEPEFGEISTPEGWTTWWREGFHDSTGEHLTGRPEAGVIGADFSDQTRIIEGKAVKMFTFWRSHDMGWQQSVNVEKGSLCTFSVYLHSWYSRCDSLPHSEPFETDCAIPITWAHNYLYVGIDPTGGNDPENPNVVWSDRVEIYGSYGNPLQVSAISEGEITVFIRSVTTHPLKHNDIYADVANLEIEPPKPDCYGSPREQYKRIYILYPPNAERETLNEIIDTTADFRPTIGGSADDAGVGDLEDKTVVAINPDIWGNLEAFYEEFYPGTNFIRVDFTNYYQLRGRLLASIYKANDISVGYPTTHMPPRITGVFGAYRDDYNYYHSGLDLAASWDTWQDELVSCLPGEVIATGVLKGEEKFGIQIKISSIVAGNTIISRYAHLKESYVNVGQSVAKFDYIGKPGTTGNSTGDHLHFGLNVNGEDIDPQYLIDFPDNPPPPPSVPPIYPEGVKGAIGLHYMPTSPAGWREFIDQVKPPSFKSVLAIGDFKEVPPRSENTKLIFRKWIDHQDPYLFASDKLAAARDFVDIFLNDLQYEMDKSGIDEIFVESLNETYNPDIDHNQHAIDFDRAFIQALTEADSRLKPIVFTAAVGNPGLSLEQKERLLPLARDCQEVGGLMGYHGYWAANPAYPALYKDTWQWLAWRWETFDAYFREHGIYPYWLLTEAGAVGCTIDEDGNLHLDAISGWQHPNCHNGNFEKYTEELLYFNQKILEWNAANGGRHLGANIFTTGGWNWDYFLLEGDNLLSLGSLIKG